MAYHRGSGEIVVYVWGKGDIQTAEKLRKEIKRRGISYDTIVSDGRESFLATFGEDTQMVGKEIR